MSNTGHWIKDRNTYGYLVCSECRNCCIMKDWITEDKWRYCPHCGSRNTLEEKKKDGN